MSEMADWFWISWYQNGGAFTLEYPWWISGELFLGDAQFLILRMYCIPQNLLYYTDSWRCGEPVRLNITIAGQPVVTPGPMLAKVRFEPRFAPEQPLPWRPVFHGVRSDGRVW